MFLTLPLAPGIAALAAAARMETVDDPLPGDLALRAPPPPAMPANVADSPPTKRRRLVPVVPETAAAVAPAKASFSQGIQGLHVYRL